MVTQKLFQERLKAARKDKKLSQEQLGRMVGLSKSAISKYESGKNAPKIEHAKALADALNISFNYLIGFSEYQFYIEANRISEIYLSLSDSAKKELYNYNERPPTTRIPLSFLRPRKKRGNLIGSY